MKTAKKISIFFLMIVLCMSVMTMPVFAASISHQDGLEVTLTTDKEEYGEEEQIEATLTVTNTNNYDVRNVSLKNMIPDGYRLAEGTKATKQVDSLLSGDTVSLIVKYVAKDSENNEENTDDEGTSGNTNQPSGSDIADDTINSGNANNVSQPDNGNNVGNVINSANSSNVNVPNTGDDNNFVFLFALMIAAIVGGAVLGIIRVRRKNVRKFLSMFLCFTFIISTMQISALDVKAETIEKSASVSKSVMIGEYRLTINAIVTYEDSIADNDKDQVADELETMLGTSSSSDDSDGDGIDDYTEIYVIGSDPAVPNSTEDADGDGLNNYEEVVTYGTNPRKEDSDLDGLNDYEEIYVYATNPLNADTDSDGITDGDEIRLGLNPAQTDNLRSVKQTLDIEELDKSLLTDNEAVPNISGYAQSILENSVTVTTNNEAAVKENRAIVGKALDLSILDNQVDTLQLEFSINSDIEAENLLIVQFTEEKGWKLLDTAHNGKKVYCDVSESGTYCVMDVNVLLPYLGVDTEAILDEINTSTDTSLSAPSFYSEISTPENATDDISLSAPSFYSEISTPENATDDEENEEGITSVSETAEDNSAVGGVSLDENIISELSGMTSSQMRMALNTIRDSDAMGQADIVFAIDTTGSMSDEISNVANNIIAFAQSLTNTYNVNSNFALVDYKDITVDGVDSTKLIQNLHSNWYTDINGFKNAVAGMKVSGGGDAAETAVDALEFSRNLDFRTGAQKFIILVTDATYKDNNNYGIASMADEIALLQGQGIVVSVVSSNSLKKTYESLYNSTGGIFADINGNFSKELMALADLIGANVNEGNWILLNDYQYISLSQPLAPNSGDTDGDGKSDYEELQPAQQKDVTPFVKIWLKLHNVPDQLVEEYFMDKGGTFITVYPYTSNPILKDTDFDGISDRSDNAPKENVFKGKLRTEQCDGSDVSYEFDYRAFFGSNKEYNSELATTSLLFSSFIYSGGGYTYDRGVNYDEADSKLLGSMDIRAIMKVHGMKDVVIYDLADQYRGGTNTGVITCGYTDDDVSEVAIGHHLVDYNGVQKDVISVIVRGTNSTLEEWSSNFDIGDRSKFGEASDWKNKNNHKGFDVASNRVLQKLEEYISTYCADTDHIYWVTGHSRGAAIANIISADLVDEGNIVFGYTFAAPNTTISEDANSSQYSCIFNLVNEDDFVPCVPMEGWTFTRYGKTAVIDMTSDMENEWHSLTGKLWYNQMAKNNLTSLVNSLVDVASGWDSCYIYTCDCDFPNHKGDGSQDDITERGINDINDIPWRVRQYCSYRSYKTLLGTTQYEVCQQPAYFMQALADIITTSGGIFGVGNQVWKIISTYQFADRYESARNKIILASTVGGIACPHYCETYYLLTQHVNGVNYE